MRDHRVDGIYNESIDGRILSDLVSSANSDLIC